MKKIGLLALAIVTAAMVLGGITSAVEPDTLITGTIDNICSISAPSDYTAWSLNTIGSNKVTAGSLTVSTNYNCDVKVAEVEVGTNGADGIMETSTETPLSSALKIDSTGASIGTPVTTAFAISGTGAKLWTSGAARDGATIPLNLDQTITYNNAVGAYSITLVFTHAATGA